MDLARLCLCGYPTFTLSVFLFSRPSSAQDKLIASDGGPSARFGAIVSAAGDLDGDGFDDVLVGAPGDVLLADSAGAMYVYYGSPEGVAVGSQQKIVASDGDEGDAFGVSASGAGDIDGDGYDDALSGAPSQGGTGVLYVYYGGATGLAQSSEQKIVATDATTLDQFGASASRAGDIDGDDQGDILVGAFEDDDLGDGSGSVYVYYGTPDGIAPDSEHKLLASDGEGGFTDETGEFFPGDWFGYSVAAAGDVNRDGHSDILVGAQYDADNDTRSGSVYIYYGSPDGVLVGSEQKLLASDGEIYDHFGISVSSAGDIDGDTYSDIVIGSSGDDDQGHNGGSAYVYYGSPDGIIASSERKLHAGIGEARDYYGLSVSAAGDLDADGYKDIVIGAFEDYEDGSGRGSAYAYYGSSTGILPSSERRLVAPEGAPGDGFGFSVSAGVDLDDDGYSDILVGAPGDDDAGESSGSVYLFYKDCIDLDQDGACEEDCDNTDANIYPGAPELCNAIDDNCDGATDGPASQDASTWQVDGDGDGFTDPNQSVTDCAPPVGYGPPSARPDCDDTDATRFPGAPDPASDGIDQDCDLADDTAEETTEKGCGCTHQAKMPALLVLLVPLTWRRRARP